MSGGKWGSKGDFPRFQLDKLLIIVEEHNIRQLNLNSSYSPQHLRSVMKETMRQIKVIAGQRWHNVLLLEDLGFKLSEAVLKSQMIDEWMTLKSLEITTFRTLNLFLRES